MNYAFSRINEAAENVLGFLQEVENDPEGWISAPEGRYLEVMKEAYGDKPEFKDYASTKEGCRKRLWDAYVALRNAAIYAERVEWWQSCDDGSLSFIGRVDEDLEALDKELAKNNVT